VALHPTCTCDIPRGKKLTLQVDHTCKLEDSDPPMMRSAQSFDTLHEAMNALEKSGIRGAVVNAGGRWFVETSNPNTATTRFQKMQSRKELSPATIAFVKSLTAAPVVSRTDALLKECASTPLNNAERAQVLDAVRADLAKAIHSRPRVFSVGAVMTKRAAMPPVDPWAIAPSVSSNPAGAETQNQPGTEPTNTRFHTVMNPTAAEKEMFEFYTQRRPMGGFPRA
jgi:hypothetical protein